MSKKNSRLILGAVILSALLLVWNFQKQQNHLPDQTVTTPEQQTLSQSEQSSESEQKISEPLLQASPEDQSGTMDSTYVKKIENFKPASLQQMREEIAKNPHATPPSGMASALQILDLYNSIKTKEEASLFLTKMKNCSEQNTDTSVAVKTTCLKYSRRLLEKFPDLKAQVDEVISASSERAIEIEKMVQKKN